jgi:hypothetical protein
MFFPILELGMKGNPQHAKFRTHQRHTGTCSSCQARSLDLVPCSGTIKMLGYTITNSNTIRNWIVERNMKGYVHAQ